MRIVIATSAGYHALFNPNHFTESFLFLYLLRNLGRRFLRIAPVIENAYLVNALQSARGSAPLLSFVLAVEIYH
jgi:hypothetical protein